MKDFRLEEARPESLHLDRLDRTVRCWRVTGTHRVFGTISYWISDEFPVHGVVRFDAGRARFDIESFDWGR